MNKKIIPIFLTIDNGYAPYAATAITSIIENSSKEYDYKIYILHDGLTDENISKISKLECNGFDIIFREMKEGLELITDRVENKLRCDYFTLTIFFRLFIANIFPEYDKGIYIDSDVVVPGDISELYNIDLKQNIIGACIDNSIQSIPQLTKYLEEAVGIPRLEYINSGVLLMDLKQFREKSFSSHFLKLLNEYHFDSVAPDQDYLNAICNGKILYLNEEWDTMPADGKEMVKNPKLIHYNLFQKPWCYDNIQYADTFWKYAKKTSYYNQIQEYKQNYSEEKKISDRECLEVLISKADKMNENDVTFKKVFESGSRVRLP